MYPLGNGEGDRPWKGGPETERNGDHVQIENGDDTRLCKVLSSNSSGQWILGPYNISAANISILFSTLLLKISSNFNKNNS